MFQNPGYSAVLRRYSDFLWLYEKLHQEKAGAIVPPLPEKQPVGRFSAAFIEDRRVNLERFLRRVAVHPELQDAKCLNTFLRADDATFHAAKHSNWEQPSVAASNYNQNPGGHPGAGGGYPNMNAPMMNAAPKQGLSSWLTSVTSASSNIASKVISSPALVHSPSYCTLYAMADHEHRDSLCSWADCSLFLLEFSLLLAFKSSNIQFYYIQFHIT